MKSETELKLLETKFAEFQERIMLKIKSPSPPIQQYSEISEEDSGIFSKSPNVIPWHGTRQF